VGKDHRPSPWIEQFNYSVPATLSHNMTSLRGLSPDTGLIGRACCENVVYAGEHLQELPSVIEDLDAGRLRAAAILTS